MEQNTKPPVTPKLLKQVATELKTKITGEVRFDDKARSLYATDASPYEIKPYGVVLPKTIEDIKHTVSVAKKHKLPILPRGGGTSLAGQTVGEAIVLDVSKYMTKVLDFDANAHTIKVEPGLVRDQLNAFLKPYKLQFTPDVSTTNRANIGGMVANNSAGTRSIKYGKSVDQTIAMTVMLSDGSIAELKEVTPEELEAKKQQDNLEGHIYHTIHGIINEQAEEIKNRYPKVMRRVGGYNLDEFVDQPFNLAKLVSGSEGTLAIILDVTLVLHPLPNHKCLALIHFDSLVKALTAVQYVNEHNPSAVEILDEHLFNLGKQNPNLIPLLSWLDGEPAAVLMVEFDGQTEAEMLTGLESLQKDSFIAGLSYHTYVARDTDQQEQVLEFRRKGLGIYATIKGKDKPTPFIEDSAIPPENLPQYIPEVLEVCKKYGVQAVVYGHASVGVIHIRPLLDLKNQQGIELYQKISQETFDLVKKYGGSWSGEHGDGLIRSYQNKNLFGEKLYKAFCEVKAAFDPDNIINPGKVVNAPAMTENLRYGEDYTALNTPKQTHFDFSKDEGLLGAVEMCTGVGACRKVDTGVMCPSYMATRDEDHSTRGRANILREAITGKLPGGLTSKEVYDVLDLCLECKACKAECPSQVDMAKIKYEFLQHYYDAYSVPISALAVGNSARVAPLGTLLAPIANKLLSLKWVRYLVEKMAKIDRRRVLPTYIPVPFARWFKKDIPVQSSTRGKVALFADTWTMYNEPNLGKAATKLLRSLGYEIELINYGCCGRPQISKGLLRGAKKLAKSNVERLYSYVEKNIPIVGLEPSCVAAFQDDYRDLVPSEKAEAVAKQVKMIDQFLAKEWSEGNIEPSEYFHKNGESIMLHGHCQQRAIMGNSAAKAVLSWCGEVLELNSGCCGMAGSFGYHHYDLSMQIGEDRLFPAVREHQGKVVACGFSCRHQIAEGTGKKAKHLAEVLAESLDA